MIPRLIFFVVLRDAVETPVATETTEDTIAMGGFERLSFVL